MNETTKYALFAFLGAVVLVLLFGFHKSPVASPQLGALMTGAKPSTMKAALLPSSPSSIGSEQIEPYTPEGEY